MRVIDFHIHLWDRIAGWSGAETPLRAYGKVWVRGKPTQMLPPSFVDSVSSPEIALAYMDMCGVERAVVAQEFCDGVMTPVVEQAVTRWPQRFVGTALVDTADPEAAATELERAFSQGGLRGWKIPLAGQRARDPAFEMDSPRVRPLLEVCRRHGAFVQVHGETAAAFLSQVSAVAGAFPEVTFVLAHVAFPSQPGWVDRVRLARQANVYHDLAGLGYMTRERYPWPTAQQVLREAVKEVGAEKLLWGTDYPRLLNLATYRQEIDFIAEECRFLPFEQRGMILGGNAAKVLGLS